MTEASIEAASVLWALKQGVLTTKLAFGAAGEPDRVFWLPGGRSWLVEFKTETGRLRPRQKLMFAAYAEQGHPVTVVRSVLEFRSLLHERLTL